jgi:cell division transport system permease protein
VNSGGFILREGWYAWRRSGLSGSMALVALSILSIFILLFLGVQQSLEIARNQMLGSFEIEAFLMPGRERLLDDVAIRFRELDGVSEVVTVTKDEAALLFAELHGEDLVGLLEENPLPASVIVRYDSNTITFESLISAADVIRADEDIDDVAFEGELLARFEQVSGRVMLYASMVGAIIVLISVLLTMQAVKIAAKTGESWGRAVFLIGGTRQQVKGPLAVSGMLTGAFAGLIGVVLIGGAQIVLASSPWIANPTTIALTVAFIAPIVVGWIGALSLKSTQR